jgi:NAD(P)-dependent dehydrogenase (short-subunit alcohol dehydrogenase family)
VNNAGITRDRVVWKMSDEEWADVLDADLTACFRYIRAAVPLLRERGGGRIVSISSINAQRGKFGQSNYTASKAGIIGLSKSVAREVGQYGVTVNVVTPGLIATDLVTAAPEEVRARALAEIVLGRLGQPEDVAALITFLATDRAKHITGAVIPVDGGQYL